MNQPPGGGPPPYGQWGPPPPGYAQVPPQGQAYPGGQAQPGYPPPGFYPPTPQQRAEDEQHLTALAIGHFIYAALTGVIACVFGVYVVVAMFAFSSIPKSPGAPPPAAIGAAVAGVFGFIALLILGMAAMLVFSGLSIQKRQRRTLSFVMACLICMNVPLGTLLGVLTLIVLNRPSVKELYDRAAVAS